MAMSMLERDWAPRVTQVTPREFSRLPYPGVLEGPLVSQFLLSPLLTHYDEWLEAQRDFPVGFRGPDPRDTGPHAPRGMRELGCAAGPHSTHSPYFKAALLLASFGPEALSEANPYRRSTHPRRFATLGLAHLVHLLELAHAASSSQALTAGACTTLLKAWFQEDMPFPHPVKPNAEGTTLEPYEEGVDGPPLTVGGELNKLCHNLSLGEDMAGVQWRTDSMGDPAQGEQVALLLLREQRPAWPGRFRGLSFTCFNGTRLTL
jgi:hypothetical protein